VPWAVVWKTALGDEGAEVKAKIRSLWAKWFRWSTISHCLIVLCLWAVSTQAMYPTLDSLNFMGWLNASVLALCSMTWVFRLFLPSHLTTEPGVIGRSFVAVDVLVLLFISYGVLLNINRMLDSSAPEKKTAVITEIIEDPFSPSWFFPAGRSVFTGSGTSALVTEIIRDPYSPGWFFPAGRSLLTVLNVPDNHKYIALHRNMVEYLLIGQEVTLTQYKGFLGMPWVSDFRVDHQSVPQDLLTSDDPIIKKDVTLSELHKEQWDRGLDDAQQYASEEPEDFDFLIAVTEVLLKKGQARPAVEFLRPIATARPSYQVYLRYADLLHTIGEREEGIKTLQVAATMDSKPIMALYQLGYRLKAMGRFGEATIAFEKLLEIQPGYPTVKEVLYELHRQSDVSMSSHSLSSVPSQ
jgi:Tetratricopeptide repeat